MIFTQHDRDTMHGRQIDFAPPLIDYTLDIIKGYQSGMTVKALSAQYHVWDVTVSRTLKDAGITLRKPQHTGTSKSPRIDESAFVRQYLNGETLKSLTEEYSVGMVRAVDILAKHGIKTRSRSETVALKKLRKAA